MPWESKSLSPLSTVLLFRNLTVFYFLWILLSGNEIINTDTSTETKQPPSLDKSLTSRPELFSVGKKKKTLSFLGLVVHRLHISAFACQSHDRYIVDPVTSAGLGDCTGLAILNTCKSMPLKYAAGTKIFQVSWLQSRNNVIMSLVCHKNKSTQPSQGLTLYQKSYSNCFNNLLTWE